VVGSALRGRIVIVDDVITAGTAIRESIELILRAGAEPVAVALALDREERGQAERSAVQEVEALYGLRCIALLTLSELIAALEAGMTAPGTRLSSAPSTQQLAAMRSYRQKYGVTHT
jgi:orotate phosphoribosyltransferase